MNVSDRISDLYCRYNGAMVGAFMADASCRADMPKYASIRRYIETFLAEIEVPLSLPETHQEYKRQYTTLADELEKQLSLVSPQIGAFCTLGSMVTLMFMARHIGQDASPTQDAVSRLLEENKLDERWLQELLHRVQALGEKTFSGGAPVLSGAFAFVSFSVRDLPWEADTAFVAMPFKEPYESYFHIFYRPLLESIGCRVIRAWGGLDIETYQPLLYTLIRKAGVMLADVTGSNVNVIHELGAFASNESRLSFSYLLADQKYDIRELPSNLGDRSILQYDPNDKLWPISQIRRLNHYLQDAEPMVAMRRKRRKTAGAM